MSDSDNLLKEWIYFNSSYYDGWQLISLDYPYLHHLSCNDMHFNLTVATRDPKLILFVKFDS